MHSSKRSVTTLKHMGLLGVGLCLLLGLGVIGCSSSSSAGGSSAVEPESAAFSRPPGVVRYCWEEPIVDYERVNPGLHSEGKWYYPAHLAVKEVRMGRWRPCTEIRSKTYGRYDNER
jgi:hypothetical protein